MRKLILLAALFLLFAIPGLAQAEPQPKLAELIIQIWPEYDQPAALVIYDFRLAEESRVPATIRVRVPKEANIFAVAQDTSQGLMNVTYEPPVTEGDYDVLTLTLNDYSVYRVEFYGPLQKNGMLRQYSLVWPGDYAIAKLTVSVQKPLGARNLAAQPELVESLPAADGFIYSQGIYTDLQVGQAFEIAVQYEKDDDALSVANQPVSLTGALETAQGRAFSLTNALPWFLGGLGLILIVGGVFWFWQSGRARENGPSAGRKERRARAEDAPDERVYCSQCGKRAEGADRFCRACGARLRRE
ncbi:MAG: zinc ribbon domain-containing protein [Anaerolineales bacterium]|jgi:hypothetical protein|nr:zinc ribbon domain-containing protein [Anaerolineales bacterium]